MAEIKYYPLTPPQEMIGVMLKYSFFHKQVVQIPTSIVTTRVIDFDLMKKAINIEIERNDSMRLRFVKKKGKTLQYFIPEYKLTDIPVMEFKTKEEQEATLEADAGKAVKFLKGETFRIILFKSYDGKYGIYSNISHFVMDAAAGFIFYADLFSVYDALEKGTEMPRPMGSYEKVIGKELAYINNTEKVKKDEEAYREFFLKDGEPIYNGAHGSAKLDALQQKNPDARQIGIFDPIHDKCLLQKLPVSAEDSKAILDYITEAGVSPECLVQLGMRLHIANINHRRMDSFFMSLCTRRRTLEEKHCGGSVTASLPWRIVMDEKWTFTEALAQLQDLQGWIFRHANYPFTAWRDLEAGLFNYSKTAGSTTMMFSWLPLEPDSLNGWDYEFTGYSMGRYCLPLYSYAMKASDGNSLKFAYLHRPNYISVENIEDMHNQTIKALNIGCKNPELTLGEIMDKL